MEAMTVAELAERIGGTVRGDGTRVVRGCATLVEATADDVSFVANPRYVPRIADSAAGCLVLSAAHADLHPQRTAIVADDPYLRFRHALVLLHGWREMPAAGVSPQAHIADTAELGELCAIRPFAYIAPCAKIGRRVVIYPHVYVGKHAVIGDDCVLHPHVCIYDGCELGQRVTVHAGCSIGHDGFGYATAARPPKPAAELAIAPGDDGEVMHHKIPQRGIVRIEDDVELGANCSIDRATIGATVIGRGTRFSNNVVIGHGCRVGRHNLFVADVGLAGSVTTGDYVVLGGQVGVAGHLTLGPGCQVAASSKVMHDIPAGEQWGGTPARPFVEMKRILLHEARLPELAAKLKRLERRIAELEARG